MNNNKKTSNTVSVQPGEPQSSVLMGYHVPTFYQRPTCLCTVINSSFICRWLCSVKTDKKMTQEDKNILLRLEYDCQIEFQPSQLLRVTKMRKLHPKIYNIQEHHLELIG